MTLLLHVFGLKSRMHLVVSLLYTPHVTRFSVPSYSTLNNQIMKIRILYVFRAGK